MLSSKGQALIKVGTMKLWWARVAAALTAFVCFAAAAGGPRTLLVLEVDGAIGPATAADVERVLERAELEKAELVVLRMDTPGGLDTSMRSIIKRINTSTVPVATFVAPPGARAASAGTYILYASHIAAMAPGTNLGAATPVQFGGFPASREEPPRNEDEQTVGEKEEKDRKPLSGSAMERKLVNDAVAYIRSLAELRGRNADWGERAVREGVSLPASDALREGVIDVLANDLQQLLAQIDRKEVVVLGVPISLSTRNLQVEHVEPDWHSRVLSLISNPNIAYVLLLIGIYGIIYELANPGAVVPGTLGGICLLLALYGLHVLPLNYAGVALLLVGLALMAAEAFVPSFGALGLGGAAAFVIGSVILIDTEAPGFGIHLSLIIAFAAISGAALFGTVTLALKARRRPVVSGREELIGAVGEALEDFSERGRVRIHSEQWTARTREPLGRGDRVRVTGVDGLILDVTRVTRREVSS
jgi:membrane-bound serine protease (ClpP class)